MTLRNSILARLTTQLIETLAMEAAVEATFRKLYPGVSGSDTTGLLAQMTKRQLMKTRRKQAAIVWMGRRLDPEFASGVNSARKLLRLIGKEVLAAQRKAERHE